MRDWARTSGRRRRAASGRWYRVWSVPVAAVLVLALALLLADTVRRQAAVSEQLLTATHRSFAELVAGRLATELAETDRGIAHALETPEASVRSAALARIEAERPWMGPLVLVTAPPTSAAPQPAPSTDSAFAEAARLEHVARNLPVASAAYLALAERARAPVDRLRALNGAGRTMVADGRTSAARETYRRLVAAADTLVPAEAYWAVIARSQLLDLAPPDAAVPAALDLYRFLLDHRYLIGAAESDHYLARARAALARWPASGADAKTLVSLDGRHATLVEYDRILRGTAPPGSPGLRRVVTAPRVTAVYAVVPSRLDRLVRPLLAADSSRAAFGVAVLGDDGEAVWSSAGAVPPDAPAANGLVGESGRWRVAAFPRDGSVAEAAARETRRYTLWLWLLFGAVVMAVALVGRSVARELALARLRADFVASVSHELKTPLALIRMFAESLREGWVGEAQKADYYEVITRESERLTGLIDNVLDFSRVEAGTREYRFVPADLCDIVDGLLKRYAFHLKAAGVDLAIERPDGPIVARVDREAVEQVLVNLLSNAVKYMGDAGRLPRCVTVSIGREGGRVVLRVADTGIGMSDRDRARIFDRFYRAGDERVRSVAGSGLGLSLVQAHVEAHGGVIHVESELDRGSTFTIDLPLSAEGSMS